MRSDKLRRTVDEAVLLDRRVAQDTAKLKALKKLLIAEAHARPDEVAPSTSGDGTTITFGGEDGSIARVSFPTPTLKGSIKADAKAFEKIRSLAGSAFRSLFANAPAYRLIPEFRERAKALLGKDAAKLIRLCVSQSSPRVSFETKDDR